MQALDPRYVVLAFALAIVCSCVLVALGHMPDSAFLGVVSTFAAWLAPAPQLRTST